MSQNIVSLNLTDAQLTAVDAALTELETQLSGLIALPIEQKRSLKKMGEKSEAFCRQALRVLEHNPQMVPSNLALADAVADLATLDARAIWHGVGATSFVRLRDKQSDGERTILVPLQRKNVTLIRGENVPFHCTKTSST